jgi:hypothetical protein
LLLSGQQTVDDPRPVAAQPSGRIQRHEPLALVLTLLCQVPRDFLVDPKRCGDRPPRLALGDKHEDLALLGCQFGDELADDNFFLLRQQRLLGLGSPCLPFGGSEYLWCRIAKDPLAGIAITDQPQSAQPQAYPQCTEQMLFVLVRPLTKRVRSVVVDVL